MSAATLTAADLTEEQTHALSRFILALADSKRVLGIRYSDWLLGAPSLEAGIAASSMAQDEWGHARLLYAMLKDFGRDPIPVEHDRTAEEYASLAALDVPFPDWAAFTAAVVFADGALTTLLRGLAEGCYEPARARIPKMVAEEAFHASMGSAWFQRLANGSQEARTLLSHATRKMLPVILQTLDPGDAESGVLAELGILPSGPELEATFLASVQQSLGLVDMSPDEGEPPIWDGKRGRAEGSPGEETVERARGDRNRDLFVE